MDASHLALIGPLVGGLGLFLLGMGMMTDGLKLAAGPALQSILAAATHTRWHALGSGILVTALVQASGAVTVATIGFINAGLLSLAPALWVLFGANVGSTMTGWLVAAVGLKFKIEALALPLVGLGAVLRLTGAGRRHGAIGTAVAGFGLLFMGIGLLQQNFAGLAGQLSLPEGGGAMVVLAQLLIGVLMTVLMQSSSASIAIALTAAQGGLIGAQGAAAVVIGANIGTTFTALVAAIGATPNARRAAAAHVIFNLITACVALALLPWLIAALTRAQRAMGMADDPALLLALFHTTFNLLGVMLMWPLAAGLTRWLQRRFRAREDDQAQLQFLDDNVLAVPALALDALEREIGRIGHLAARMARAALLGVETGQVVADQRIATALDAAVERFVERMHRAEMTQRTSRRLAWTLRVMRYYETASEQALAASALTPWMAATGTELAQAQAGFARHADDLFALCDPQQGAPSPGMVSIAADRMERSYQTLKAALLLAGADGQMPIAAMEQALRRSSALRRAAQQMAKASGPFDTPAAAEEAPPAGSDAPQPSESASG
ncbi:MAG: Na/Pi cotransporter family protein [Rhodoferax sp.]|nr:Na/Pi cotransporter family protein [Rhodoferax sp.]